MRLNEPARYIANDFSSSLRNLGETEHYLTNALEDLVSKNPPLESYHRRGLLGLWAGPTGLAYLLLQVSHMYPDIIISGSNAISWAQSYIRGSRRDPQLDPGCCGIGSEKLAFAAVQAAVTKDLRHVQNFVAHVPVIVDESGGNIPDELLYGRAGVLYLMRMMRHWVPGSAPLLAGPIEQVSRRILADGPGWTWHGKRYLGAVHGDIGIVTQLVLTTPALAGRLGSVLDRLLGLQVDDGNWPSSERREVSSPRLTQFCHGAPGFIISLRSLRPFFPDMQARIDEAVQKGCECVWSKGLLRKEPSLCHGIFGNALALPLGAQRDHFLAIATPDSIANMRRRDRSVFQPADYGDKCGTLAAYLPSAAWAWTVHKQESPTIIGYSDV